MTKGKKKVRRTAKSASHLSILLSEVSDGKVYLLEERPTLPNVLTYLA